MPYAEDLTPGLRGMYRDVLHDARGRLLRDAGWRSNAIADDCRRLLAAFMRTAPNALGIQGLQVGMGQAAWDSPPGPPPPTPAQTALVDPNPETVGLADLQIDFLQAGATTAAPTNRLQIVATLGPNVPPWPDPNHPTSTLREFGLVGDLAGNPLLINYVTHPAIVKDPTSTLTRTIWLVF